MYGQYNEQGSIDSLKNLLANESRDTVKVALMIELMHAHTYYKSEEGLKYEKALLQYLEKSDRPRDLYMVKFVTGKLYWRLKKYEEALSNHLAALSIAEKLNLPQCILSSTIAIGQDHADHSNYPEALKYFNKALSISIESKDKLTTATLYNLISWVYGQQGNYPERTKNDFIALRLSQEIGDQEGIAINYSNIAGDYRALGNDSLALQYLDSSINLKNGFRDLINLSESYFSIGEIYQDRKKYSKALEYYMKALKNGNDINDIPLLVKAYYQIAKLYVVQGNDKEALKNYLSALNVSNSTEDYKTLSEIYIEIGACLTRMKKYVDAKKYFDKAEVFANRIQSESLNGKYYENIELLDSATGNWKEAYRNYKSAVRLNNKLHNDENTKKIMQTTMQYEFDKKEAAAKAEQEKKEIRQRLFRNSISGILLASLIFLVIVYRQRNKISKARKRSDELLLNILPEEVADELKQKGNADAKLFENVTVMFTDFKGFTRISEKLSPAELVAEIHTCFKAFDNIIDKHHIEKIKTIGDAYMCAGGLPITNKTHAEDVVNAAIEIQKYMTEHIQKRIKEGKEVFEMRIGIHTGPVVAGIVGVKKFAYDIWGDTVNIASRMESSGEAGRINVSGSTYEFVKNKFQFEYRGKVEAKNKGEIDMYFVKSH